MEKFDFTGVLHASYQQADGGFNVVSPEKISDNCSKVELNSTKSIQKISSSNENSILSDSIDVMRYNCSIGIK